MSLRRVGIMFTAVAMAAAVARYTAPQAAAATTSRVGELIVLDSLFGDGKGSIF